MIIRALHSRVTLECIYESLVGTEAFAGCKRNKKGEITHIHAFEHHELVKYVYRRPKYV